MKLVFQSTFSIISEIKLNLIQFQLLLAALVAVAVAAPAKLDKEPVAILRQSKDFRPDGSINFG